MFFEPGPAEQVAAEVAALNEVVVGLGAPPADASERMADEVLSQLGVQARPPDAATGRLVELLDLAIFRPDSDEGEGRSPRAPSTTSRCSRPTPTASSAPFRADCCRRSAIPWVCSCASRS